MKVRLLGIHVYLFLKKNMFLRVCYWPIAVLLLWLSITHDPMLPHRKIIERLLKLLKRAPCIVLNANYDTASSYMFEKLGWSTITKRHNYNEAVTIDKALNNLTPTYISDLLTQIRTLRSSTDGSLAVPVSRTAMFDGSFACSAPRLWNDLPECVRSAPSLNVLKKKVRERF